MNKEINLKVNFITFYKFYVTEHMKAITIEEMKDIYKEKKKFDAISIPTDLIGSIDYGKKERAINEKVRRIERQLENISIECDNTAMDIFIDRYINNKRINYISCKYNICRTTVYNILNKAKKSFAKKGII